MAIGYVDSLRKIIYAWDERRHARLVIPVTNEIARTPAVYFLTPDHNAPSGGVRVIYRHVDLLNAAGIPAFVLHQHRKFRCTWFPNETRVTDITAARVGRGDLLVVTEPDVCLVCEKPPGTRHAIFNQSISLTWKRAAEKVTHHYKTSPDLAGVITVSDYCADLLHFSFERIPVHRVHLGIDPALFHPGDGVRKRRIAYMPRRGKVDAENLLNLLRARRALDGWEVVSLNGLTHVEIADQLQTTRIFLSFGYQEGFGLPPAEAMACGNYVIGYHGFGGKEYFLPEFSAPIATGDILSFANAVENAVIHDGADSSWCLEKGRAAAAFIRAEYTLERERNEVVSIYTQLMRPSPVSQPGSGDVPAMYKAIG
jgi:hypothetical protein